MTQPMSSTTLLLKRAMAEFNFRDLDLMCLEMNIQQRKECRYADYIGEMRELSDAIDSLAQRNIITIQKDLGTMRDRWNALHLQLAGKGLVYMNQQVEILAKGSATPSMRKFPQFLRLSKELNQFDCIPKAAKEYYIATQALLTGIGNNKTQPLFITRGYEKSHCLQELQALYVVLESVRQEGLSLELARERIACFTTSFSFVKGSMNMYMRLISKSRGMSDDRESFIHVVYWICCEFALHGFISTLKADSLGRAEELYRDIFSKLNVRETYIARYVKMKAHECENPEDGAFRVIVSMCNTWGIEMPNKFMNYRLS